MASRAFDLALTIKDFVAAWYDDVSNGLADDEALPARRFVTLGLPPVDCDEFCVAIEGVVPIAGDANVTVLPTDSDPVGFWMRAAVMGIWIFRCWPTLDDSGNPPPVDDEEAATQLIMDDFDRFERILGEAFAAGELPGCGGFAFVGTELVTPEGGFGGGVLRCQVSME